MDSSLPDYPHSTWRATLAKLLCAAILGLIFAGGVVTSKNVGLSVPDWPTSFGYHMWGMPFSMWKGGALYEHTHRVLASGVGCLVLFLTGWVLWKEPRTEIQRLSLACLGIVMLQGMLGGATVLLKLPKPVSIAHGVLAQLFFCLAIALAYALSRERAERLQNTASKSSRRLRRGVLAFVAAVGLQLIVAATMRHDIKQQGGVAVPDFPQMAGSWMPWPDARAVAWVNAWRASAVSEHGANFDLKQPVRRYQLAIHLLHRGLAGVLAIGGLWLTRAVRRRYPPGDRVRHTVYLLDALLAAQVVLGMLVVWSNKGELITSLHVVTGAAVLGTSVLLALRAFPAEWSARAMSLVPAA